MDPLIVAWFSCGHASAVTAKLVLETYATTHEVVIARCVVPDEHPDGDRFASDCEAWFGHPITNLRSAGYADCEAVWRDRRYMSGVAGAPCTIEMKKAVRWAFEQERNPALQAFGFTADEAKRAVRFRQQNPFVGLVTPLIDAGMSKAACHRTVAQARIRPHAMYGMGFPNANCIGCVKSDSPGYWNLTRRQFPEVFAARAALSREIGCKLIKTTRSPRVRMFLDELPPDMGLGDAIPDNECGLLCGLENAA